MMKIIRYLAVRYVSAPLFSCVVGVEGACGKGGDAAFLDLGQVLTSFWALA